jgi:hypothetical protein
MRRTRDTTRKIRRHPESHQLVDRTMRRALLRRFPYAVFFEAGKTEIVVYGLFHAAETHEGGDADETHDNAFYERRRLGAGWASVASVGTIDEDAYSISTRCVATEP